MRCHLLEASRRLHGSVCLALAILVVTVGVVVGVPTAAAAQAVTGTLLGNVTDPSGGALPGATVTATEVQTNSTRTTVSNETGYYVFSSLKNGTYTVEAEMQGFKKVIRQNVRVDVNTTMRVDLSLAVGNLTEEVTVSAESPLLQTDRADTGRIIQGEEVARMPLGFNRNFQGMLITVPGATRPFRPHSEFFNPQDSLSTQINGQSRLANNVMLDGIDNNHKTGLLTVLIPSADALETVNVSTSNYDAEFGRAGGAITAVTLKSGTNNLKGSVYVFGNTEATQASQYFTHTKAPTEYLTTGFTVGGPIRQNRLFYFGDYQRTRDHLGRIVTATVPTMAFRNGDLSAATTRIYDPTTGNPDGSGRTQFPGNQVPVSPIARRILSFIPEPNIPGAALGQNNYQAPLVRERTTNAFNAKLNWQASQNNSLSYRFSFQRPKIYDPGLYGIYGGPSNGGFAGTGTNLTFSTAATWTRVFSNTLVMDVRGGVSYYHNEALSEGHGLTTGTEIGIPGANLDEWTSGIPQVDITGYTNPVVGFAASLPWDRSERTTTVATTLTKLWGNHTFKLGGEWRHNRDFLLQTQDAGGSRGQFQFRGAGTGLSTETATLNNFANAFASFLIDWPQLVQRDLRVGDPGTRHWAVFSFFHDKWQLSPTLTVDLGLRWEYYTPLVGLDSQGGLANYDMATNTILVAGYGETSANLGVKRNFTHFSPRTGLSYRLNDISVLRAGYGTSTIPFPDNRYAFHYPVKQTNALRSANAFQRAGTMAVGFPTPALVDIPSDGRILATGPLLNSEYFIIPADLTEGTLHSWNVAFQRELPWRLTAEVAYVGNYGQDIVMEFNRNAGFVPGADNAGRPQFAQFGRTGTSRERIWLNSKYHSMQVKLDRRFQAGLLVTNSYTLGRGWDYHSENGLIATPIDPEQSWARSDFDRTHNYVLSFVYELPWGVGKRWLSDGVAAQVLGGWAVSGIFAAQSGTPINITADGALLRAPGNTHFPNLNADQQVLGTIGPGQKYFDTTVYSLPPAATLGNMSRNAGPTGPAFVNLDASLVKQFPLRGRMMAQFRVDVFNVTNSPHFNNPNGVFGQATFGEIGTGGAFGERRITFAGNFVF
jgi:outer membrane receptor protein involved in Fe transport